MTAIKDSFRRWITPEFNKQVSIAPLIVFRLIFGALMLFGVLRFIANDWVEKLYILPAHHFGFLGFEWVKPLPGQWMYLPFILMGIGALGILLGLAYRFSAGMFALLFTYVELIDKTNYLNHYYFVSLMAFLMVIVPANRHFSLDAVLRPSIRKHVTSRWHIWILQFQLAVVYVFAGIAKINADWLLHAEPLRTWLQAHHHLPLVGKFLKETWVAYVFSWFGCVYDLLIVVGLTSARWRPVAYCFVVVFHFITWCLFPIGVFPWVMIFSTLIFFSAEFHHAVLRKLGAPIKEIKEEQLNSTSSPILMKAFLMVYISIQLLVPMRYLLYSGDLFWHEQGFRFSWRVMLMHKEGYATYIVEDRKTGEQLIVDHSSFLTPIQLDQVVTQPDMILQYARIIQQEYDGKPLYFSGKKRVLINPIVRAEIVVALNGRPSQLFVSKKHDLTAIPYDLCNRDWLEPFHP